MLSDAVLRYVIIYWTARRQAAEFENYIVSNLSPNDTQGHRAVLWVSRSVIENYGYHRAGQAATITCAGNRTLKGKMASFFESDVAKYDKYLPKMKRRALRQSSGGKSKR
jgi:hypothetical protein